MTFPTIETTSQNSTAASTSHAITLPSGISTGDLLLLFFATDGDNTITNWDSFTQLGQADDGKDIFFSIGYRIATGSDACTLTTSVSEPGSHVVYRISGHDSGQAPELSTVVIGDSDVPDPSTCTPTGGAKDYLWVLAAGWDTQDTVSAWNANFTLSRVSQIGGGVQDCSVGVSGRNENVASKNPGSMTLSGGDEWIAWTVAVHSETGPATYEVTKNSNARIKRLGLSVTKTADGRILIEQSVTKTSDARIVGTKTITKNVNGRIIGTDSVTKASDGRIKQEGLSVTKAADARIVLTKTVTKTVDVKILVEQTVTKTADARILATKSVTKTSDAKIVLTKTVDKTVDARILATKTVTKSSDARILREGLTVTKTVNARIVLTKSVTKTSDARIKREGLSVTKTSDGRIKREGLSVTKTCDAKITGGFETKEVTKTSDSRIFREGISVTKTSNARILVEQSVTKTADAKILLVKTVTKTSNARILRTISITKTSDGRIFRTIPITKTADGKIKLVVDITKPSDARIFRSIQVSKSSDARIAASLMGVKVLKTCDAIIMPPDWPFVRGICRGRDNSEGETFRGRDTYETTELHSRLKR